MKKNTITLNETQLQNVIKESVQKVLNETLNNDIWTRIDNAREMMGDSEFIDAIIRALSTDQAEELMDFIERSYELNQGDYEEEDF